MSYFDLAVALTRAEAAPTLARAAQKAVALGAVKAGSSTICCCSAYPKFPHRAGSGACPGQTHSDVDAEMLRDFDATEAAAVNSWRGF